MREQVSGWVNPETDEAPHVTTPHEEWIFDRLMRSARQVCGESESGRSEGESALRAAAVLIARGDSQHFFRVVTARSPREKKVVRAELLQAMRHYRRRNPDRGLKDYINHAERDLLLKTALVDGTPLYTFDLVSGEYVLRSLDKLWAQAGRSE